MEIKKYEKINETLYFYTHSTGVKVYMVTKPGFAKFSASFSTHFGSIDNTFVPIGESEMMTVPDGVAHFLEHKVFEQKDGGNVFEMFGRLGGSANAYTSFNMTNYYFWATSNYEENLKTLIKFVQAPYFTKENVEKEQGIIGQEIGMYKDNPDWRCYFNMLRGIYSKHTVRLDIAGTVESISQITDKTLYTCYNTFYHPSNMCICVVGDFDPEKIASVIDASLKPLECEKEIPREYPNEPDGVAEHIAEQHLPVSAPIFCAGFKDSVKTDGTQLIKRRAAVQIALKLLFGSSSECYNSLYNEKIINGYLNLDYTAENSYAFVEISGESSDPEKAGERLLETAGKAQFTQEEFLCAKHMMYGRAMLTLDDSEDYMQNLSRHVTCGLDMYEIFDVYENITAEDVRKVCGEILTKENYCLSVVR
ncbi:MAG: pitrilysin family protein [Bacillota bacterium]|nr:pitrilysin family protein [Bacillota bacterium]